jgi:hypothetical protein
MAEPRVQPDILVEIGPTLLVRSITTRAQAHMMALWRDMLRSGQTRVYELPSLMLDPLVHRAAMDGLLVVIRKGGS